MTFFVVVIFGIGVLFVTSAIEDAPLKDTFTSILSGQKIAPNAKTSATPAQPTPRTF